MRNSVVTIFIVAILFSCISLSEQVTCDFTINEQFYNGSCQCAINAYRMFDGTCRPCPGGTSYYEPAKICASVCTSGTVWSNA